MPSRDPQGESPKKSIYMPYGASGGGGQGGNYVFTDLAHLDNIITKWTKIRDDIRDDGIYIGDAIRYIVPPADDGPSLAQAKAARESLVNGQAHNAAMYDYADRIIQKLQTTREQYATTEETNTDTLRNADQYR
ncbi:PE domain-containing protein [Actinophytocola sp.]|uniref:PE domain-containing protein n=1 Tax=Actinophytocola sp. TaxID=1872138 RepID=UPI002ED689D5